MIILQLFIAAVLTRAPQTYSTFGSLFPSPTGRNGFEDYARAADILRDGSMVVFKTWVPAEQRPTSAQVQAAQQDRARILSALTPDQRQMYEAVHPDTSIREPFQPLASKLDRVTYLGMLREKVDHYSRALQYIEDGNAKPCAIPVTDETKVKGIGSVALGLDDAVELECDQAYIQLADGKSDRALAALRTAITSVDNIASANMMGYLVSLISNQAVFNFLDTRLDHFSESELAEISEIAKSHFANSETVLKLIRNAYAVHTAGLSDPNRWQGQGASTTDPLLKILETLSPQQLNDWLKSVASAMRDRDEASVERFSGSEDAWLPTQDLPQTATTQSSLKTLEDAKNYLLGVQTPIFDSRRRTLRVMTDRARWRILYLRTQVELFRMENNRLPTQLNEIFKDPNSYHDPLSGQPFQYEKTPTGYRLVSRGTQDSGTIELKQSSDDSIKLDSSRP
jgi:hypothetical protein